MIPTRVEKRGREEDSLIRTKRMTKASETLEEALSHIEAIPTVSSLVDFSGRVRERRSLLRLIQVVKKCEQLLATKHLQITEEEEVFFPKREVSDQEALLNFYQQDPDEIAAYLLTHEKIAPGPLKIPICQREVFYWLIKHADGLSFELAHAIANQTFSEIEQDFLLRIDDTDFCVNKLLAATKSHYFQKLFTKEIEEMECAGASLADFSQIIQLIQTDELPSKLSNEFLRLVDFFDFREPILQRILDQIGLNFKGNVLQLEKPLHFLHHPFFRRMVHHVKLIKHTDELLEFSTTLDLRSLEVTPKHHEGNLGTILKKLKPECLLKIGPYYGEPYLKELQCQVELIDATNGHIQDAASFTQNLVNYVVYKKEHISKICTFKHLRKLTLDMSEDLRPFLDSLALNQEIEELYLYSLYPIDDESMHTLTRCYPNLFHVTVAYGSLTEKGFLELVSLEKLVSLKINHSSFYLNGMERIEHLTLREGTLNQQQIEEICRLPRLKVLNISDCKGFDQSKIKNASSVKIVFPEPLFKTIILF